MDIIAIIGLVLAAIAVIGFFSSLILSLIANAWDDTDDRFN